MKHAFLFLLPLLFLSRSFGQSHSQVSRRPLKVAAAVAPEWPHGKMAVGKQQVRITVTTDGYFGNVIEADLHGPRSSFSDVSEAAARLWKFYPAKANSKQTLTFVFEVFPNNDHTRRAAITFVPPYKIVIERGEGE